MMTALIAWRWWWVMHSIQRLSSLRSRSFRARIPCAPPLVVGIGDGCWWWAVLLSVASGCAPHPNFRVLLHRPMLTMSAYE